MGDGADKNQNAVGGDLTGTLVLKFGLLNADMEQLKAEVKELKGRPPDRLDRVLRSLGILTIAGGLIGVLLEVDRHFTEKAAARKFVITDQILKLDRQLSSDDPGLRRDAARLLATIGPNSVRVLVEHLDNPRHETEVYGSLARGLKEILADKKVTAEKVLRPLIDATRRVLARELADDIIVPETKLIVSHVQALGVVSAEVVPVLGVRIEVKELLAELQERIRDADFRNAFQVRDAVQEAVEKLN